MGILTGLGDGGTAGRIGGVGAIFVTGAGVVKIGDSIGLGATVTVGGCSCAPHPVSSPIDNAQMLR
jgi:hypothetical protein